MVRFINLNALYGFIPPNPRAIVKISTIDSGINMDTKLYVGIKAIRAIPMNRADYNAFRQWDLPKNENGADEGYLVEYQDGGAPNVVGMKGYVSWSPKEQFENAYRECSEQEATDVIAAFNEAFPKPEPVAVEIDPEDVAYVEQNPE